MTLMHAPSRRRRNNLLLAGTAALALGALGACGNGDGGDKAGGDKAGATQSQRAAANARAGSPIDKPFSLKDAEESDVDAILTLLGYEGPAPYESARFDDKLGATVLEGLRFAGDEGNAITIARAELFGLDADAIAAVKNGEGAVDADFTQVFDKIRLYDLTVDINEAEIETDSGDEQGISLKTDPDIDLEASFEQFGMTIGALEFDSLRIREGGIPDMNDPNPAFFLNAFDLSGLYMKDYAFRMNRDDVGNVAFNAPDFRIVGVSGGKLDSIIANDLEYNFKRSAEAAKAVFGAAGSGASGLIDGPLGNLLGINGQQVQAEQFTWRGIDASKLVEYGLKEETPPTSERDVLSFGRGEIRNIVQYVDGKKLMSADSSTFEADEFTWLIPNKIRSETKNAVYDLTAYVTEEDSEILSILKDNGLSEVTGDSVVAWTWDDKSGSAALDFSADSPQLADISMAVNLSGLEYETLAAKIEAGEEDAVAQIGALEKMEFKIIDTALLDTAFAIAALQTGASSPDELRTTVPTLMKLTTAQMRQQSPALGAIIDGVAGFISKGGTLTISANPEEAVPFATLEAMGETDPQALPGLLGLSVSHNAPSN